MCNKYTNILVVEGVELV